MLRSVSPADQRAHFCLPFSTLQMTARSLRLRQLKAFSVSSLPTPTPRMQCDTATHKERPKRQNLSAKESPGIGAARCTQRRTSLKPTSKPPTPTCTGQTLPIGHAGVPAAAHNTNVRVVCSERRAAWGTWPLHNSTPDRRVGHYIRCYGTTKRHWDKPARHFLTAPPRGRGIVQREGVRGPHCAALSGVALH